ncbi:MAG: hypothetical protein H3C58_02765 [Fimbriimonadaceae bacterium]|nr:hypothetical protein [Fimbriimonadaceae bacterium]
MHRWTILALLALGLGCRPASEPPVAEKPVSEPAAQGGSGSGVQVHSPGLGGVAPVTGTESLRGGGSAVGQTLKDRARGLSQSPPPAPDIEGD